MADEIEVQLRISQVGGKAVIRDIKAQLRSAQGAMKGVDRQAARTSKQLKGFGGVIQSVGQGFKNVFQGIAIGLGAGLFFQLTQGIRSVTDAFFDTIDAAKEFESAFAGVRKTLDASEEQFAVLSEELLDLSTVLPLTAVEIAGVAEVAGQLGIAAEDVTKFTETVAGVGIATTLTAEEAAFAFARIDNIVSQGKGNFNALGAALVDLGNNSASTESEIVEMSLRIAAAGEQVGLTRGEILAFSASLASVGVKAQVGGTALSKAFRKMAQAVAQGSDKLQTFAQISGTSVEKFSKNFREDAAQAMAAFLEGLGKIPQGSALAFQALEDLELADERVQRALLSAAEASDQLTANTDRGNRAFEEAAALQDEVAKRLETTDSKVALAEAAWFKLNKEMGDKFLPSIGNVAEAIRKNLIPALQELLADDAAGGIADVLGNVAVSSIDSTAEAIRGATSITDLWVNALNALVDHSAFRFLKELGLGTGKIRPGELVGNLLSGFPGGQAIGGVLGTLPAVGRTATRFGTDQFPVGTGAAANQGFQISNASQDIFQAMVDGAIAGASGIIAAIDPPETARASKQFDKLGKNALAKVARALRIATIEIAGAAEKGIIEAGKASGGGAPLVGIGPRDTSIPFFDAKQAIAEANGALLNYVATLEETRGITILLGENSEGRLSIIGKKTEQNTRLTRDWGEILRQVTNLFQIFGGEVADILTSVAGGIAGIGAGLENIDLGGGKGLGGGLKGFFSGGAKSIIGNIVGGFQVAGAAIGIGKAIFGLFKKDPIKKAQKQIGKLLGFEITREIAKEIKKQADALGIALSDAVLLNITKVAESAGKTISAVFEKVLDLMVGVADGSIPAAQGIDEIGRAFSKLKDEVGGTNREVLTMIQGARQLGIEVPEIMAAVAASVGEATEGFQQAFADGNVLALTAEDAGAIFSATFWAKVAQDGLGAAIEAFGSIFDALQEQFEKLGVEFGGQLAELFTLDDTEELKQIGSAIDGLTMNLRGLSEAGFLTRDSFNAFQNGAAQAFAQLTEAGVSEEAALLRILPLLAELKAASELYGIKLDENTQKLIEQAEEAGASFPPDPILLIVDLLAELVRVVGGVLPQAFQGAREAAEDFGRGSMDALRLTASGMREASEATSAFTREAEAATEAIDMTGIEAKEAGKIAAEAWSDSADDIREAMALVEEEAVRALEGVVDASDVSARQITGDLTRIGSGLIKVGDIADIVAEKFGNLEIPESARGFVTDESNLNGSAMGDVVNAQKLRYSASGDVVTPRVGGQLHVVGEGGDPEIIAPVKAVLNRIGNTIADRINDAGGQQVVEVNVFIDGEQFDARTETRISTGEIRVARNSLVKRIA